MESRNTVQEDRRVLVMIQEAIQAERAARRNDSSSPHMQPGITIDLGSKNISSLPETVVDLIKHEVERFALAHNLITRFPSRLPECTHLRYLNVRYNLISEFPTSVLGLTALEILDISKNQLRVIPEEISTLQSLRVLAISRNRVERLPESLGGMGSLRILKLDGNPIIFPPPEICSIQPNTPSPANSNDLEVTVTSQIKRYMRQVVTRRRLQVESEGESSEGNVITPRPPRRTATGRFPVNPSISGTESFVDPRTESPGAAPPIPVRSHHRIQSQQAARARPAVTPLVIANSGHNDGGDRTDRNRSQSESVTSSTLRSRRMGMITRKNTATDLGVVEESHSHSLQPPREPLSNTTSHRRGLSHVSSTSISTEATNSSTQTIRPTSMESPLDLIRLVDDSLVDDLSVCDELSNDVKHKIEEPAKTAPEVPVDVPADLLDLLLDMQPHHDFKARSIRQLIELGKGVSWALAQLEAPLDNMLCCLEAEGPIEGFRTKWYRAHWREGCKLIKVLNAGIRRWATVGPGDVATAYDVADDIIEALEDIVEVWVVIFSKTRKECLLLMRHSDERFARSYILQLYASNIEFNNALRRYGLVFLDEFTDGDEEEEEEDEEEEYEDEGEEAYEDEGEGNAADDEEAEQMRVREALRLRPCAMFANEQEGELFKQIFRLLEHACQTIADELPNCRYMFQEATALTVREYGPHDMASQEWHRLLQDCEAIARVNHELTHKLLLRDPRVKDQREFWELCSRLEDTWFGMGQRCGHMYRRGLMDRGMKEPMRPIHSALKHAAHAIAASPWGNQVQQVPATPLSAALGPAAQATIPTTR